MSDENKLEETQAVQGSYDNSYPKHFTLIEQGAFLLKVIDSSVSKDVASLAESKLQEILSKF